MSERNIQVGPLYRSAHLSEVDEEARTATLSFSSEEPVERWDGYEILDHSPDSVRLGRLQAGGPVLVDHDPRDHVGVVESVDLSTDRRGRSVVRFGRSARAQEIMQDVVDGIRRSVSVGYRIYRAVREDGEGGRPNYRVTDWEPMEVSMVSVPADVSVGVGRAENQETNPMILETREDTVMSQDNQHTDPNPAPAAVDIDAERERARKAEHERTSKLLEIGETFQASDLARSFVRDGKSVEEFRMALLDQRASRPAESPEIGLSETEVREFSFLRALRALANPADRKAQQDAAYEFEVSQAAAERAGREARGILVPADVLKRDLTAGTDTAGGHTVSTDLLASSFIDLLRNRTVVMQRATQLTDLNGNIAIPRQTGGASAYWVAESGAPTESQQAFDQVTMSPNTVGAYTDISRRLMLQSSLDVEAFVRRDLATVLALEIDRACINGSGSGNQPTGILNTTGIGDVAGGTDGAAPTFSHIVDLETEVSQDNADIGSLFYVTNAKVRGTLKQTEKATGTAQYVWDNDMLNGYSALTTNQVPSDLDKGASTGVASAIIFGNLVDLLVGMWGGLDLQVDPYSNSTSGTVRVVALQDMDIAVRHPESFAAMQDALTS